MLTNYFCKPAYPNMSSLTYDQYENHGDILHYIFHAAFSWSQCISHLHSDAVSSSEMLDTCFDFITLIAEEVDPHSQVPKIRKSFPIRARSVVKSKLI